MNHHPKAKLAVGLVLCLFLSNILIFPRKQNTANPYDNPRITAYASSSNADKYSIETASNSNCDEIQTKGICKQEKRLLATNAAETTLIVGSGEEGSYDSLTELFSCLDENTGILTIELAGDTSDSEMIVVPRDKGIKKVIIRGDENYQIGTDANGQAVDLAANGIPMQFDAGYVYCLVGGGCNTDVTSTNLTVTGGRFHSCTGGGIVTKSDSHAIVSGTANLTFDGYIMDDPAYKSSQIYGGGQIVTAVNRSDVSVGETKLTIINSDFALDMIMGGHYISGKACVGTLGQSNILIYNSSIVLGDGVYGVHAVNGHRREDMQTATCDSVSIEVCDSTVEGDIGGGSFATADGIIDIGSIAIYAKDSNIASIQAGGIYMGAFHFGIENIDVTLDSCLVNGSHMFEEEYSMVGAGCYVGEDMTIPENDLHVNIGNINYTFLDSVLDDPDDVGDEGLLFFPKGYIEPKAVVAIDKTILKVCGSTDFSIDGGALDKLQIQPPSGTHFTTAQLNGEDIPRDEMDMAQLNDLETDTILHIDTSPIESKPQPAMSIIEAVDGRILKTIGEPGFSITTAGGIEGLSTHYTSSDPSVAEIDEYGTVTIKRIGTTTLTAYKQSIAYQKTSAKVELVIEEAAASLIPEPDIGNKNYILIAKKVTPEIQKTIEKEISQRPEFVAKDTQIINMEIELIDTVTNEPVNQTGATFTIAYPLNDMKQNPDQYEITILHIPSQGDPYLVPLEKTNSGIKITVNNFSPFVMGYKKLSDSDEPADPIEPEEPDPIQPEEPADPVVPDPVQPEEPVKPVVPNHQDDDDDEVITGRWVHNVKGWWYRNSDGTYPRSSWACLPYNGVYQWYLFDEQGYMVTGWAKWNHNKYYLHDVSDSHMGYMYTGWHQIKGNWYYFNNIPGRNYGILLVNTVTPDGYQVDQTGAWIPKTN